MRRLIPLLWLACLCGSALAQPSRMPSAPAVPDDLAAAFAMIDSLALELNAVTTTLRVERELAGHEVDSLRVEIRVLTYRVGAEKEARGGFIRRNPELSFILGALAMAAAARAAP